ncbi:hypothetical protein SEVIR_8G229200v4 [Setaria viridis]|uniref:Bifunctional inhibitor/plant lipid transfer protein/seed storage helical domain-containing protein n=1 Tax=Setaria viridis TaxID=4556 RepID=A0A4U6TII0_SETVI|nr:hypothetical protein SEVIR_8G229100v2 [Setaria viridis]TKW02181.1 hypothetical protein SEVIR_8G229200v2 [Setaria viridis]
MDSASGALLRKVIPVACILLVLLSMGSPVMADIENDCRAICIPRCSGLASDGCNSIIELAPTILKPLNLLPTCEVRIAQLCLPLCMNVCTLNTLTPPGAPTPAPVSAAAPPPCKP